MSDPRCAALESLKHEMTGLLEALEASTDASPEAARPLETSWARCSAIFDEARALIDGAGERWTPELRSAARDLQRMTAVASSLASRARESIATEIRRIGEARQRLDSWRTEGGAAGSSCDVAG